MNLPFASSVDRAEVIEDVSTLFGEGCVPTAAGCFEDESADFFESFERVGSKLNSHYRSSPPSKT